MSEPFVGQKLHHQYGVGDRSVKLIRAGVTDAANRDNEIVAVV